MVIGFAYDADVHCNECAWMRFGMPVPDGAVDSEGNEPHPIFVTDEGSEAEVCGDCGELLVDGA